MKRFATILVIALSVVMALFAFSQGAVKKGSTVAFVRNGDIWLMDTEGGNQRPFVAGITNATSRLSWSADNKRLAFSRRGEITIKYPEGGGGQHRIYDLFYAFPDSTNNWWEGITETMGAMSPEFSRDGSKILFIHDQNGNVVNASKPKYRMTFYDTKSFLLRSIEFETGSEMPASSPTMSPDMKQVAFVLMRISGEQFTPAGITVATVAEFPIKDDELLARAKKLPNATTPSWSPDGLWIAYISSDMADPGMFIIKPDLTGKKKIHNPSAELMLSAATPSWSPDSKWLLFNTVNGSIYKISVNGGEAKRLSGPGNDSNPAWCN